MNEANNGAVHFQTSREFNGTPFNATLNEIKRTNIFEIIFPDDKLRISQTNIFPFKGRLKTPSPKTTPNDVQRKQNPLKSRNKKRHFPPE